MMISARQRF